jgi:hypothetical protein
MQIGHSNNPHFSFGEWKFEIGNPREQKSELVHYVDGEMGVLGPHQIQNKP